MDIPTGAVSKFPQVMLFFQERYYLLLVDPDYPFPQFFSSSSYCGLPRVIV